MHYLSFCDRLIFLSINSYRFIHVIANGRISFFFLRLNNIPLNVYTAFSLFNICQWILGWFPSWATVNSAAMNMEVLHHSGCYNKIPQTGWLIRNKNLFFTVLMADSLRSWCQYRAARSLYQVADFLLYPHLEEGTKAHSWASFLGHLFYS